MIPVWISNPFTIGPMFAFTYWMGTLLMPATRTFSPATTHTDGLESLIATGTVILVPMALGGCVVGAVSAGITYLIIKKLAHTVRRRTMW